MKTLEQIRKIIEDGFDPMRLTMEDDDSRKLHALFKACLSYGDKMPLTVKDCERYIEFLRERHAEELAAMEA